MRARNWLLLAIGSTAAIGSLAIAVNLALDPWGLYHAPRSRKLPVYGDGRVGKYLLNTRYVGANFNGILIGSSMTANWNMGLLRQARIYNESLDAGTVLEEKTLVEQVLQRPGIEVAFLVQDPYFTHESAFRTVTLTPQLWRASLGSDNLLNVYKDMARERLGKPATSIGANGAERFDHLPSKLNATLQQLWQPGTAFAVDPAAYKAYRELVDMLRAHHVQIVFLMPPVFEGILEPKQAEHQDYVRRFATFRQPGDLVIDFNTSDFQDFRSRRENFFDGIHLVSGAADQIVMLLSRQVDSWLAEGRLHFSPQEGPVR